MKPDYPEVRTGDDNAKADVESGLYEKYHRIGPDDTVLDIGAHVGHFSQMAADRGATVIAFEPEYYNFQRLKERLGKNPKVTLVNAAAWDADVEIPLFINPENSGAHTLFQNFDTNQASVPVKCVDINGWLEARGFMPPTFAKIDAEGSEYLILSNLALPARRFPMAVEIHSRSLYLRCSSLMRLHQYEFDPKEIHIGVCYAIP